MILNTLEYKIQQYTDFTNEKQKIFPPSSFVSNSLPHFISKEPTGMAGQGDRCRVIFLPLQKNSTSGMFGYSAGKQENGQKVKTRQQRRKKNCQIKTSRKQVSQNQDLQKKISISITGKDKTPTQLYHQCRDCSRTCTQVKCMTLKVYAHLSCTKSELCFP